MELWLNADIKKQQFSTAVSRNPNDFTKAPGDTYTIPLPTEPVGFLSIPLASSILSAMEFCGFCLKGKFKNFSRSEDNIKRFYKENKSSIPGHALDKADISKLIKSCRHGFAHKFFPKHLIGVGYFNYSTDLFISDASGSVLNTSAQITHITIGIRHIIESPNLYPDMQKCYDDYLNQVENGTITLSLSQKAWRKFKKLF